MSILRGLGTSGCLTTVSSVIRLKLVAFFSWRASNTITCVQKPVMGVPGSSPDGGLAGALAAASRRRERYAIKLRRRLSRSAKLERCLFGGTADRHRALDQCLT